MTVGIVVAVVFDHISDGFWWYVGGDGIIAVMVMVTSFVLPGWTATR